MIKTLPISLLLLSATTAGAVTITSPEPEAFPVNSLEISVPGLLSYTLGYSWSGITDPEELDKVKAVIIPQIESYVTALLAQYSTAPLNGQVASDNAPGLLSMTVGTLPDPVRPPAPDSMSMSISTLPDPVDAQELSSANPEPQSWLLMILGLGLTKILFARNKTIGARVRINNKAKADRLRATLSPTTNEIARRRPSRFLYYRP